MTMILSKAIALTEAFRYPGGFEAILKSRPRSVTSWLIVNRLRAMGATFQTILDGGANVGQFARAAHRCFPEATIFSFEPLADIADQLEANLQDVAGHQVFRTALGSYDGKTEFHRNSYSQSSSVKPMLQKQGGLLEGTQEIETLSVPIGRFDTLLEGQAIQAPALLKLDLQGNELEALKGAEETLTKCSHLLLETVFDQEYVDEPLFEEIWTFLRGQGFHFERPLNFSIGSDGRICQMDALFCQSKPDRGSEP